MNRIVIEHLTPSVDNGRYPVKSRLGEYFTVTAYVLMDGHDLLQARLCYRHISEKNWHEVPMVCDKNDGWQAGFNLEKIGRYIYTVKAWPDKFGSWKHDTLLKQEAGQDISLELIEGKAIIEAFAVNLKGEKLKKLKRLLSQTETLLLDPTEELIRECDNRAGLVTYDKELVVLAERERANFSSWYEFFPRSIGTFADCEKRLPAIRAMGFDVVYLPPIHPIGTSFRKGKNNAPVANEGEPGSPYAIGSSEGGHKAIHSELGTLEEFRHFVQAVNDLEMEVALDIAIQCSPDHPYIKDHPEWFSFRPDGTIRYAENPPKKYQDIVNVHFESEQAESLCEELRSIILYWIKQGVKIFRVDNPHTKPFHFWEWLINSVQKDHPEVIFLAEAFTRPHIMMLLAKLGFTQSYSYFTWRNTKAELTEYLTELTGPCREYYRPNFFANTPDILPYYLQTSGRPGFMVRLALAATLATNYGIYSGYELCEDAALPGKEEYLDSEKYEIKHRDWNAPGNINDFVTRMNHIRHENKALQQFSNLKFYPSSNDQVLFYGKMSGDNAVFCVINLDPHHIQETHINMPLHELGIANDSPYMLDDLLLGHSWQWTGVQQFQHLDPMNNPVAIFRIQL